MSRTGSARLVLIALKGVIMDTGTWGYKLEYLDSTLFAHKATLSGLLEA